MMYDYQAPPESYFPENLDEENDLDRCMDESPHVVTFWNAVCAFINHERAHGENPDRVLECPSWGQWRSIVQHHVAGKKVEAIKLLRASTYAWTSIPAALPPYIANEGWRAFMAANALPSWDRRGGLSLSEAKSIIDTLETAPHWFGRDTNREFNSPYVTCADGGHVPEKPEHSLWLNVYPVEPGYCRAAASRSRADADWHAEENRIACINITFKEGEGL